MCCESENCHHLLVFDSAYSYEVIKDRKLEAFITCRDLDGLMAHVWSVNPLADLERPSDDHDRFGPPRVEELSERHTVIEGRVGRSKYLQWLGPINFVLAQLSLFLTVLRLCRVNGVAIVRAEDPLVNGAYAWLFSRLFNRPLMIGVWGNPGLIRNKTGRALMPRAFRTVRIEAAWEARILRSASLVMVQNHDNAEYVESQGIAPDRIVRFALGNALHETHWITPVDRVSGRPDLADILVSGTGTILCLTRLVKEKLPDHALRAFANLRTGGIECELVFVGDGAMREELETLAISLGVGGQVIFAGNRDQEWIGRVIPAAAAVVVPLGGRALAEAALGAAPVAAYDLDWHSDLVESGVTGELVPYGDIRDLTDERIHE